MTCTLEPYSKYHEYAMTMQIVFPGQHLHKSTRKLMLLSHLSQKSDFGAGEDVIPNITAFPLYSLENQYGHLQ